MSNIRIITISGRIGSGSTTLAKKLSGEISWKHIEGGEVFWEAVRKKRGLAPKDTNLRSDGEDVAFDEELTRIAREEKQVILETKLSGFNSQAIPGVFKILLVCDDKDGNDQTQVRIDRLVNREHISVGEAKEEILSREANDLAKWRKLYAGGDPSWSYYDPKYYDLVINTFMHNQEETLKETLKAIGL